MDLGLTGKVAIITGGSRGIGLETSIHLAYEGVKIAIVARNEEQLQKAAAYITGKTGTEVLPIQADVTQEDNCKYAVDKTAEHFGRLDIVINNAGTANAKPFEQVETALWKEDLDVKLFGAIHCSRYALPYMKEVGGGSIVNITTSSAKTPPASGLPTNVSRAAGLALTKAMSKDLASYQIRVNTVCIGLIRSSQIEKIWKKKLLIRHGKNFLLTPATRFH